MTKKISADVGHKAPAFSLMATGGREVSLTDYLGRKHLVLYFYPKDMTPGCTTEACAFRDAYRRLLAHDVEVLGVSRDALDMHERFAAKHDLPFPLLSDSEHAVAKAYGVYGKKSFMGREFMGIARTTFVIDRNGTLTAVFPSVKVEGHADQVLKALQS